MGEKATGVTIDDVSPRPVLRGLPMRLLDVLHKPPQVEEPCVERVEELGERAEGGEPLAPLVARQHGARDTGSPGDLDLPDAALAAHQAKRRPDGLEQRAHSSGSGVAR